jgi:hypothetical protein
MMELGARLVPAGTISLQKEPDDEASDPRCVALRTDESAWDLFRLDEPHEPVGDHCVEGTVVYQLDGGFAKRVDLRCTIYLRHVSQDWFLFDEFPREAPVMTVSRDCWIDEGTTQALPKAS